MPHSKSKTKTAARSKHHTKATKKPPRKVAIEEDADVRSLINECFNLNPIKKAISEKYGSSFKYCQVNGLHESEVSNMLGKKIPLTIYMVYKHCKLLGLRPQVTLTTA